MHSLQEWRSKGKRNISSECLTHFFKDIIHCGPRCDLCNGHFCFLQNQSQNPPFLVLETPSLDSPSTVSALAPKSTAIDDVLEILIRNGGKVFLCMMLPTLGLSTWCLCYCCIEASHWCRMMKICWLVNALKSSIQLLFRICLGL